MWSRTGRELFYLDPAGRLTAVAVDAGAGFAAAAPKGILEKSYFVLGSLAPRSYDVSPDGRRFLMIKEGDAPDGADRPQVVVVLNWTEELKRRVPGN